MYDTNYLVHHGRLGQKWGKKNGPPYPLDYKDLSSEEREHAKSSAISRGDVKEAYFNRAYFNNQEIEAVMSRFNTEQRLKDLSQRDVVTGTQKAKKMIDTLGTVSNGIKAVHSVAKSTKEFVDFMNGKNNHKKKTTSEEVEYQNGKMSKRIVSTKYGDDTFKTTYNYDVKQKANKEKAYKSEEKRLDMINHPEKYSDEQLSKAAQRYAKYKSLKV